MNKLCNVYLNGNIFSVPLSEVVMHIGLVFVVVVSLAFVTETGIIVRYIC